MSNIGTHVAFSLNCNLACRNSKTSRVLTLHIIIACYKLIHHTVQEQLAGAREAAAGAAAWWRTRETKADATLRQQAKLIDFLQVYITVYAVQLLSDCNYNVMMFK